MLIRYGRILIEIRGQPALKSKPPTSKGRCLGYARVSTYGQTLDAQLEQLKAAGCTKIYREKASGAQPDRRELLTRAGASPPCAAIAAPAILLRRWLSTSSDPKALPALAAVVSPTGNSGQRAR